MDATSAVKLAVDVGRPNTKLAERAGRLQALDEVLKLIRDRTVKLMDDGDRLQHGLFRRNRKKDQLSSMYGALAIVGAEISQIADREIAAWEAQREPRP